MEAQEGVKGTLYVRKKEQERSEDADDALQLKILFLTLCVVVFLSFFFKRSIPLLFLKASEHWASMRERVIERVREWALNFFFFRRW